MSGRTLVVRTHRSRLPDGSAKSNLGDLLRASVVTRCLEEDFRWLTDRVGCELLAPFIGRERIVVLEELGGSLYLPAGARVLQLDDHPEAARRVVGRGLRIRGFVPGDGGAVVPENDRIASLVAYRSVRPDGASWQESLITGLGFEWKEQDYPAPVAAPVRRVDVGLNHAVHAAWTSKAWPLQRFAQLAEQLSPRYRVSWQRGIDDLSQYIHWLSSCRVVVTADSLGLHLASALRCRVLAVVGPCESREHPYGRVRFVRPTPRPCMPCQSPRCAAGIGSCLSEVDPAALVPWIESGLRATTSHPPMAPPT